MLEELYSEVEAKKEKIKKVLEGECAEFKVKNWSDIAFSSSDDYSSIDKISGVDGSFNFKRFIDFALYAAAAYACSSKSEIMEKEVDIITNQRYLEERLRIKMALLELKAAEKISESSELVLLDGSLVGNIIRPMPFEGEDGESEKEALAEYVSYLKVMKKFLESAGNKAVAVSKSSTRNEIFRKNLPDIAVYQRRTSSAGCSEPFVVKIDREKKKKFLFGDDFFRSLEFTSFYARLERNRGIFSIEIPRKAEKKEISELLEKLCKISVEGYPYPLIKAHRKTAIKNKDIELLSNILGINLKTGREALA